MNPDENEAISFFFSPEILPRSIFITNFTKNIPIKHIKFLFSKSGEIEAIYQNENSLILIYLRENSVEFALFYDHFKIDSNSNEINVKRLSDLSKKEIAKGGDLWKEIKETSQKILKPKDIKSSSENTSLRSSFLSQPSENDLLDLRSKTIKKMASLKIKEPEMTASKIQKKYDPNSNLSLSVIKEDNILAEKSPKSNMKLSRSYFNKENEFSIKLTKVRTSSIENQISSRKKSENFFFTFDELGEIPQFQRMSHSIKIPRAISINRNINDFNVMKESENSMRTDLITEEIDEPQEKIFQPLKNIKTSIGKYYKYEDIFRDSVLNKEFLNWMIRIWVIIYIFQHLLNYYYLYFV